jgi:hypothetical protein
VEEGGGALGLCSRIASLSAGLGRGRLCLSFPWRPSGMSGCAERGVAEGQSGGCFVSPFLLSSFFEGFFGGLFHSSFVSFAPVGLGALAADIFTHLVLTGGAAPSYPGPITEETERQRGGSMKQRDQTFPSGSLVSLAASGPGGALLGVVVGRNANPTRIGVETRVAQTALSKLCAGAALVGHARIQFVVWHREEDLRCLLAAASFSRTLSAGQGVDCGAIRLPSD